MAILATAWHVVSDAEKGTSTRLCDQHGAEVVRSKGGNMAVMEIGSDIDCGLIVVTSEKEIFSRDLLLPVLPWEVHLRRGTEVGWLGYPGITEPELCFFHGHISGMRQKPPVYLVDGVAINGVSGGPVFDNRCHLAGLVSAYQPNAVDESTTLPGVSWMVPINYIYAWVTKWLKPRDLFADKDA